MASAKQGVHVLQCRAHTPSDAVLKGERFYKFDDKYIDLRRNDDIDAGTSGNYVHMRTDPNGHIVYWLNSATLDKEYVEVPYILDVRYGSKTKHLSQKDWERAKEYLGGNFVIPASAFDHCLLTIICGYDFVNLTWLTFVATTPEVAEHFGRELFALSTNIMSRYGPASHFVRGLYAKIRYGCCDSNESEIPIRELVADGRRSAFCIIAYCVPGQLDREKNSVLLTQRADCIVRTIARNKDEYKLVEKALELAGFNTQRAGIPVDQFTPEAFYRFYCNLSVRDDITEIFNEIIHGKGRVQQNRRRNALAAVEDEAEPAQPEQQPQPPPPSHDRDCPPEPDVVKGSVQSASNTSSSASSAAAQPKSSLSSLAAAGSNITGSLAANSNTTSLAGVGSLFNSASRVCITWKQFEKFLNAQQRDSRLNEILYPYYNEVSTKKLIRLYERNRELADNNVLSLDGFQRFLLSDDNGVLAEEYFDHRPEDMNEPISHYFINSSHNTYLPGDQVGLPGMRVRASVEIYRLVLIAGCRCVELDICDGSAKIYKGEPIISHGNPLVTSCTPALFKDTIEAIAECAFKTSEYPLTLSFDNACSKPFQTKMASYLKDILGDMLLAEPLPAFPLEPGVPLPPPSMLRNKILLKNKKQPKSAAANADAGGSTTPNQEAASPFGLSCQSAHLLRRSSAIGTLLLGNQLNTGSSSSTTTTAQQQQQQQRAKTASVGSVPPSLTSESLDREAAASTNHIVTSAASDTCVTATANSSNDAAVDDDDTDTTTSGSKTAPAVTGTAVATTTAVETTAAAVSTRKSSATGANGLETVVLQLDEDKEETEMKVEVGQELSSLVNYMTAMGRLILLKMDEYKQRNMSCEIYSCGDNVAYDIVAQRATALVAHNKRQVTRVFPKATIRSRNYNPKAYWNAGCQMVAINFQELDLPMQLNLGLFDLNGRSGYALKPECMRKRDTPFNPFEQDSISNVVANTLSIQVMSAQILCADALTKSEERLCTYVECKLHGLCADTVNSLKKCKTVTVPNNGLNPRYATANAKPFEFTKIIFPELAQIRLVMYDERTSEPIAQRVLPVLGIRPGYRHIVMHNAFNQPLTTVSLFCKIVIKDYVPASQQVYVNSFMDPITWKEQQELKMKFADALMNPIKYQNEIQMHEEMLRCYNETDDGDTAPSTNHAHNRRRPTQPQMHSNASAGQLSSEPRQTRVDSHASFRRPQARTNAEMAASGANNHRPQQQQKPPSSAAASSILDTFDFGVPDFASLTNDAKIGKLFNKQEAEVRALKDRQAKDREQLVRRLAKTAACSSANANSGRTSATSQTACDGDATTTATAGYSDRPADTFAKDDSASVGSNSRGMLKRMQKTLRKPNFLRDQTGGGHKASSSSASELTGDAQAAYQQQVRQHRLEEQQLQQQHVAASELALLSLLDAKNKQCVNSVELVYKREVAECKRTLDEKVKKEIADLTRNQIQDKQEAERQKQLIRNKIVDMGTAKRIALHEKRTNKEQELRAQFDALRKHIETEYAKKREALDAVMEPTSC